MSFPTYWDHWNSYWESLILVTSPGPMTGSWGPVVPYRGDTPPCCTGTPRGFPSGLVPANLSGMSFPTYWDHWNSYWESLILVTSPGPMTGSWGTVVPYRGDTPSLVQGPPGVSHRDLCLQIYQECRSQHIGTIGTHIGSR